MSDSPNIEDSSDKEKSPLKGWSFPLVAAISLLLAFAIPYALTYRMASRPYSAGEATRKEPAQRIIENATAEAVRSGLIGALVAFLILTIWKVDRTVFSKDKDLDNNARIKVVVCLLAFALWVVWTSSGYIMIRANDEINDQPPELPGIPKSN